MRVDEILTVLYAFKEGKKIQVKLGAQLIWTDDDMPIWDFWHCEYRVKPKPREWMLLVDRQSNGVYGVANEYNQSSSRTESVLVREVIP